MTSQTKIKHWKDLQRNIELKFLNQKGLVDDTIHSMTSNDSDDRWTQTQKTHRSQTSTKSLSPINPSTTMPTVMTRRMIGPRQTSPTLKLDEQDNMQTIAEVAEENPKSDSAGRKKQYRTSSKVAFSDIPGKAVPKKGVLHSYQMSRSPEYRTAGPQHLQ